MRNMGKSLTWRPNVWVLVCVVWLIQPTIAQTNQDKKSSPTREEQIQLWIDQLHSDQWKIREKAAGRLVGLPESLKTDRVRLALIELAERECKNQEHPNPDEGEGPGEYYSWLLDKVAEMKDLRAWPFFLKGGSPILLLPYGEMAVEPILAQLNAPNINTRTVAIEALGEMLKKKESGYTPTGETRRKIKQQVLAALEGAYELPQEQKKQLNSKELVEVRENELSLLRLKAVIALANDPDEESIAAIKKVAEADPHGTVNKRTKEIIYWNRIKAKKILEELKEEKSRDVKKQ